MSQVIFIEWDSREVSEGFYVEY